MMDHICCSALKLIKCMAGLMVNKPAFHAEVQRLILTSMGNLFETIRFYG